MSHSHQTTNLHDLTPYHKLTERQDKAWRLPGKAGETIRLKMAGQLGKMYPSGCGVCSATMKLIAYVQEGGKLRLLLAPFKVIPISAIANKPRATECPCFDYYDPEVRGPWKNRPEQQREKHGGHHPMCQYQRDAGRVFSELYKAKNGGLLINEEKNTAARMHERKRVRPDLMLQVQRQIRGG